MGCVGGGAHFRMKWDEIESESRVRPHRLRQSSQKKTEKKGMS